MIYFLIQKTWAKYKSPRYTGHGVLSGLPYILVYSMIITSTSLLQTLQGSIKACKGENAIFDSYALT